MISFLGYIALAVISLGAAGAQLHERFFPPLEPRVEVVEQKVDETVVDVQRLNAAIETVAQMYESQALGASGNETPTVVAFFETSLANAITSSQTTMSLVSATMKNGSTLASSTYPFVIDEGTASEEMVLADCTSTTCTNMIRGIDPVTGTSTVASLQKAHRRGASVKITTGPQLLIISRMLNGIGGIPNPLYYNDIATTTVDDNRNNLASVGYVQDIAFNGAGAVAASETVQGYSELATQTEAASSTSAGGTGARLVLPASISTSTYNSATAARRVVVTQPSGKIDNNFIATSTLFGTSAGQGLATSTAIGSFPAYNIGKNVSVITTTGTSTFSIPSGITKLDVTATGAGGGGGGCSSAQVDAGGGGGAGGTSQEMVDVSGTSTVQVFVGSGGAAEAAGTWSTFGTNGSFLSATGGSAGAAGSAGGAGGAGGVGSGGDINMQGQGGGAGQKSAAEVTGTSGAGGTSRFGGGAPGVVDDSNGVASGNYGGGGSGAACTNNTQSGGAGAQGIVIIRW